MTDKKLEKYEEGCPKEGGVHFGGQGAPEDKVLESLDWLVTGESHEEGTPYQFTHVTLAEIIKQSQPGICFNWGAKNVGFGQITIVTRDGELYIDDENMSKEFIKEMFGHFIDEYYKKERE